MLNHPGAMNDHRMKSRRNAVSARTCDEFIIPLEAQMKAEAAHAPLHADSCSAVLDSSL